MPEVIYGLKIQLSKLDKSRFFKKESGELVLDLVMKPTKNSKYGDSHILVQNQTKEERQNKVNLPIIGNAKVIWSSEGKPSNSAPSRPAGAGIDPNEDCPF